MNIRRRSAWFLTLTVVVGITGCSTDEPSTAPQAESTAEASAAPEPPREVEAPPTPASTRIRGTFSYEASHGDARVQLGVAFDGGTLVRSTSGAVTSRQPYRVLDEGEDSVLIELVTTDERLIRRTFVLLDDDRIVDDAAPDVVYVRLDEPAADGSGATATDPTSPPAPSAPR